MAKPKKSEHPPVRPKVFSSAEEIQQGIEKLRGRMFQVEELKKDGIPYRDAMRVSAEFQIRESIRDIFGERSPEFQEHQQHRIKSTNKADLAETRALLENLITQLEEKKQELLDPDSSAPEEAPEAHSKPAPPHAAAPAPHTAAKSKAASPSPPVPPRPQPPQATPTPVAAPPPPSPTAAVPPPPPSMPIPAAPPPSPGPVFSSAQAVPPPRAYGTSTPVSAPPPSWSTPAPSMPPMQTSQDTIATGGPSSLDTLRKICTRFHLVARKLRQRREDRPTLEVEDESDVQDVIHALMSLEFDDIRTEEWTPGYGRTSRMDFLLPADGIVLEVKKTRQGFGAKEIASQLWVDFQRYLARPDCRILFCFVYDPEGRIGNPRRLETELTRVSDGKHVEVLISPK